MKLFKKFLFCVCASALALGFASCGDDEDDPVPTPTPDITVEEKEVKLSDADASSADVTFNASETWKATSDAGWCTVSPSQGTNGNSKKITVSVTENTSKDARVAHVTVKTINGGKLMVNVTVSQPGFVEKPSEDVDPNAPDGMKSTGMGIAKKIKVGWNLGNTGEATDEWTDAQGVKHGNNAYVEGGANLFTETSWQNAKTTKEMFTALKNAGFNAIRVPVRWYRHADANLNINKEWMARVKEIVDYAVSQDMYVILNSHHDNWYDRLPVGYNETDIHAKFKNMWTQIASSFKDYDEHLIFAAANEIISVSSSGSENWGNPTDTHYKFVNDLMQLFVTTVRATGGNNEWRCLMVQPWACNPSFAINDKFILPKDSKQNRLIVEYHCYDPYNYAIGKGQKDNKYAQHEPSQNDLNYVSTNFSKLNSKFVAKGIPCIMAEFGSTQDNNYSKGNDAADKIRADYHTFIVKEAKKYNIPGFYWDNYCFDTSGENFGLLDRKNCNFPARAKIALQGIMDGLK